MVGLREKHILTNSKELLNLEDGQTKKKAVELIPRSLWSCRLHHWIETGQTNLLMIFENKAKL